MSKDPDGELFRGDVNLEAALELLGMREPIDTSFALECFALLFLWYQLAEILALSPRCSVSSGVVPLAVTSTMGLPVQLSLQKMQRQQAYLFSKAIKTC